MTDALPPLPWLWNGEALVPPSQHWARRADASLVVGQTYTLEERQERSSKSHAHYFACVADLWQSLPDSLSTNFPTPEHLRKHALIQSGYRDERSIVCASKAEALRVAAFIRPMDDFAAIIVRDALVIVLTAKSQNLRSMDRATFAASKQAVLDYLSDLVGVPAGERRAAA